MAEVTASELNLARQLTSQKQRIRNQQIAPITLEQLREGIEREAKNISAEEKARALRQKKQITKAIGTIVQPRGSGAQAAQRPATARKIPGQEILRDYARNFEQAIDDNTTVQFAKALSQVATDQSKFSAVREGLRIGGLLKQRIQEGEFQAFYIALFLALFKDFIIDTGVFVFNFTVAGIPFGQAFRIAVNLFVTLILFRIIFMQGTFIKRLMLRRLVWVFIAEYITFIAVFPSYTIAIIMIYRKLKSERLKNEKALEIVLKETNKIQNAA